MQTYSNSSNASTGRSIASAIACSARLGLGGRPSDRRVGCPSSAGAAWTAFAGEDCPTSRVEHSGWREILECAMKQSNIACTPPGSLSPLLGVRVSGSALAASVSARSSLIPIRRSPHVPAQLIASPRTSPLLSPTPPRERHGHSIRHPGCFQNIPPRRPTEPHRSTRERAPPPLPVHRGAAPAGSGATATSSDQSETTDTSHRCTRRQRHDNNVVVIHFMGKHRE